MVITKPIPANINIGGFSLSFRYRGQPPTCFVFQEVRHTGRGCLKSRRARRSANSINNNKNNPIRDDNVNKTSQPSTHEKWKVKFVGKTRVVTTTQPSSKSEEDLTIKLNAKRAAKPTSKDQVETTAQKPLPPQKEIEHTQGQQIEPMDGSNAVEPLAETPSSLAPVALMATECFSSPPNRRSRNAKHQRYTRWDGKQAVITSPTVAVPSTPELNGPETSSVSTSAPAAHLAALRQMFNLPSTSVEPQSGDVSSSSVEEQFKVLAHQSRSVAGHKATCTSSFVHSQSIT